MISFELDHRSRPTIVAKRDAGASAGAWANIQSALARGVIGGDHETLRVRAEVFLSELANIQRAREIFGEEFSYGPRIREQLHTVAGDRRAREAVANSNTAVSPDELVAQLHAAGFVRPLKAFQLRNLSRIVSLPHAADFSVPGAGKTTVALANYALQRATRKVSRLLVIAPIAAFEAWKADSALCIDPSPRIAVHRGPGVPFDKKADILLTNYNRAASDYERIHEFVSSTDTHLILDEAHRVKKGSTGVHGRAVLDLSHAARRRDVLTGTPAPQGAHDLVAPIQFLYPGQDRMILPSRAYEESLTRDEAVISETSRAIQKFFVRTAKSELDIPAPTWEVVHRPMSPIQSAIYQALLGRYRGSFRLDRTARRQFDRLGQITMYLLEAATNPALLVAGSDSADEEGFAHPPLDIAGDASVADLLNDYNSFETPWKYEYLGAEARRAARLGQKLLIWTTFVRNIRILSRELSEFEPASIHGGVPSEDTDPRAAITRESELDRFRNDPSCTVLLANPAAAGEGISLHHWCHHAIYLDRTFNAGHFLQSQDRIHRLGLEPGTTTRFTILASEETIDDSVDGRLREKVKNLATLMNDPALVRVALPESDEDHDAPAIEHDDISSVIAHIEGS